MWQHLKLAEEGTTREERIKYRLEEDRIRGILFDLEDHTQLHQFIDWCEHRREQIEMAKRGRKPAGKGDKLFNALKFVSMASKDTKQGAYQTHVHIAGQQVVAFDGVLAAGHPIDEDFVAFPHLEQLMAAIETAGKKLSLTIEDNTLSVTGENIKATVQCLPAEDMHIVSPDENKYPMTDAIKAALEVCMRYTREGAQKIHETAVLLEANSCYGTNSAALVEYWHGVNLPSVILPRSFCAAVVKVKSPLVGFGWNDGRSVTFHFEDNSWIKTQLYTEGYPEGARTIMNIASQPVAVPETFFNAVSAVANFSEDGSVIIENGQVLGLHEHSAVSALYEVKDLLAPTRCKFNADYIMQVSDLIKSYDLTTDPKRLIWFGDNVRGMIMGING